MKPYYEDPSAGITIWHADCRDILPSIDATSVDLLLTDPPYGIKHVSSPYWDRRTIAGDGDTFDPAALLVYGNCVLWGANNYCHALPQTGGWLVWDKRDRTSRALPGSDAEMAWCNVTRQIRLYRQVWMPHTIRGEPLLHPTQKPLKLMMWVVSEFTKPGDLILDPYMGSGPVARACQLLGRRYVGIELMEEYCKTAVNRLNQPTLGA